MANPVTGLSNLPVQLTSFVGREREIDDIQRQLHSSRLVTLTGAGGSGKTRLAMEVANSLKTQFTDGVWLVELASLNEPALVPQVVAQALGILSSADQPLLELLLGFTRPKQMLLVLDNCEHLTEACAQLTQELLSQAPDLRILATSREPLAIKGEWMVPVSGLSQPSTHGHLNSDPMDLMHYDAVRLFVERAQAVTPGFEIIPENGISIVDICQRLDGLPLALELASARVNVLSVEEIRARLNHRFSLLISAQARGVENRHRTLRAAIDWSYSLLTADEQVLLRRLAVFTAGFSLDMAEAVCCGEEIGERRTLDQISSLVSKSLLIADTIGRAQARYRLLETIREYALEKLEESRETAQLRDRNLELYLARAEEAAPKLNDAYQQLWLNWLEGEYDNLRAALAWSLKSGQIESGLRICIALSRFWEIRGHIPEGMAWYDRLLDRVDDRVSVVIRANAFTYAAFCANFLRVAHKAVNYARQAVELAKSVGEDRNPILILAMGGLSTIAEAAGDHQTAFEIGKQTIQLLRRSEASDLFLLGMSLLGIGNIAVEAGHFDEARELLDEALLMAREAGDAYRTAHIFTSFGNMARYEGNYVEAIRAYENSVKLLRELEAHHDLAAMLRNLGRAYMLQGKVKLAKALFIESLEMHQAEQSRTGMVECLIGLGSAAVLVGRPAAGVRLLAAGRDLRGKHNDFVWPAKPMEIELYLELAQAQLNEAEFQAEQAAGHALSLEQAVDYAQNLSFKPEIAPEIRETPDSLTGREREVSALVGQGKTNGEIANKLVISKRTVEKHVGNILFKLGLTSRSQIVRWFMEHSVAQISE